MKKYFQIILVLFAFITLVLIKDTLAENNNSNNNIIPTRINKIPKSNSSQLAYKDGTYDGSIEDAVYGNLQVEAVISDGKLTDIVPLQYPNDNNTSYSINTQAFPILRQEALSSQNANVDIVTGASDSSPAFLRSLQSALEKAKG